MLHGVDERRVAQAVLRPHALFSFMPNEMVLSSKAFRGGLPAPNPHNPHVRFT